jgi:hypothetical protein
MGPPPPNRATAKYFAEALMYCWSPVRVESLNPVKHSWRGKRDGEVGMRERASEECANEKYIKFTYHEYI